LPYPVRRSTRALPAPNRLIKEGAHMVTGVEDIVAEIAPHAWARADHSP
jgi:predicted Rossmann fold nucleotide-binding protein DprA/Smf involved in DNA uptake